MIENDNKEFRPINVNEIKNKFNGIRKATNEEIDIIGEKIKNSEKINIIIDIMLLIVSIILTAFKFNIIIGILIFIIVIIDSIKSIEIIKKTISIKRKNIYVADCDIYNKWWKAPIDPDRIGGDYYIKVSDKNHFYINKKIKLLNSEGNYVFKNPENYYYKLYLFSDYNIIDCLCVPIKEIEIAKSSTNMYAIIGFILSFVILVPYIPLLGLILSIIGFNKSKDLKKGKGLSIAGIIISIVSLLLLFIIIK